MNVFFDLLPAPAYIFDDTTLGFLAVNPAAIQRYGYTREEFLGLSIVDIRPEADREAVRNAARSTIDSRVYRATWRHMTKGGEIFPVEVVSQPIIYQDRRAHYVVINDLTESDRIRREAEQRLQDLNTRLRSVSARAQARREEDRTRLSRELHDQLGQALASLKIDLCWLRDRFNGGTFDCDELTAKAAAMIGLVDDTILRVRRLSSELRPPVLDRLGLVAAIEWQIDEFQRRSQVHVRLQRRVDTVPLDLGRSTAVFRIFQEALTNIVTHANATQASVRLSTSGGSLVLAIADNGDGIPAEFVESGQSLGLIGMRERAELLGGDVTIRRNRPHGTIVTVTIPLMDRRKSPRESW